MSTPMKEFLGEDFLLGSDAARRLYFDSAAGQPIYDYHSHLSPADIAADRRFGNPIYHWTHIELRNPLGIDTLLNASTAEMVWRQENKRLANTEETHRWRH